MVDILEFQVNEVIGNLISKYVDDVKKDRKAWVHPTFPTKDEDLPQATIESGSPIYENDSAGDFLFAETLGNGDYVEYLYKKTTYPIHIYVSTKKLDAYKITYENETLHLTNKPLNLFIKRNIINAMRLHKDELLYYFDGFRVVSSTPVFEGSEFKWISDIECEIKAKDCWKKITGSDGIVTTTNVTTVVFT